MGRSMDPGPCFVYVPSETNEKIYKRYRNRFNKIKETAKKNYYHQKFEEAKGNIRSNWKLINEVVHKTKSKVSVSDQFIHPFNTLRHHFEYSIYDVIRRKIDMGQQKWPTPYQQFVRAKR